MQLWGDSKTIEKSETNAMNHRSSGVVSAGTHTGGSISIGEHRKRLAIQMGRDPTPSELHLHVHTYGHDGKTFIDERSRIVHLSMQLGAFVGPLLLTLIRDCNS